MAHHQERHHDLQLLDDLPVTTSDAQLQEAVQFCCGAVPRSLAPYTGSTGLAYALWRAGHLLGRPEWQQQARDLAAAALRRAAHLEDASLLDGECVSAREASCHEHHLCLRSEHEQRSCCAVCAVCMCNALQAGRACCWSTAWQLNPGEETQQQTALPACRRAAHSPSTQHLPTSPCNPSSPHPAPPRSGPAAHSSSVAPLLSQYAAICTSASHPGSGASDEVLYGRAGTLLGGLLLRQHLGPGAVPDAALTQLAQAMLMSGA